MITEQSRGGSAGAVYCSQCEQQWQRILAALQTSLPPTHFQTASKTIRDVWRGDIGLVDGVRGAREEQQFELVLSHDCAAVACTDPTCGLCCNSTSRRCSELMLPKYLVRDPLVAGCGAPPAVHVKRRSNGSPGKAIDERDFKELPKFVLQVCALPLAFYLKHQASIPWANIQDACTLTAQAEGSRHRESVLHCKETTGALEDDGFVSFPHALDGGSGLTYAQVSRPGGVPVPEVFFAKRSGESLLDGKQPQIVLAVRAVTLAGVVLRNVKAAVTSAFCVATRRVKGAMKVDIPSMDQEVRVLVHIGDACIRKLHELHMHVDKSKNGVVVVPEGCEEVRTVAQMGALIAANRNSHIGEKRLYQGILNMNEEKWKELQKQIVKAVQPDSFLRVFYCGTYPQAPLLNILEGPVDMGLVFNCNRGTVDLQESGVCGVVMRSPAANLEAYVRRELLAQEPHLLSQIYTCAQDAWLLPGHPGWGLFKFQGASCTDIPPAFREAEQSGQHTTTTYPCDTSLIACYTPSASTSSPKQHVPDAEGPEPPAHAAAGGDDAGIGITSAEMNAGPSLSQIFSPPGKAPDSQDLFHLSRDPMMPVQLEAAHSPPDVALPHLSDAEMLAAQAFGVPRNDTAADAEGAYVGASVFDSVSLKGLTGMTTLSSLFASAVSLPSDDHHHNKAEGAADATPSVINWMATTSNALNMGVNVSVNPRSTTAAVADIMGGQPGNTAGGSDRPAGNSAFAVTATQQGEEASEGGLNLRRPRSHTLGSSLLDVARSARQRLRPDTEEQANACHAKHTQDGHAATSPGEHDVHAGLSFLNGATKPSSLSKFFAEGLSIDLSQPDLSLNSNLFNSRPVNGTSMLPGQLSNDLQAPGDSQAPSLPLPGSSSLQAFRNDRATIQHVQSAAQNDNNHSAAGNATASGGGAGM